MFVKWFIISLAKLNSRELSISFRQNKHDHLKVHRSISGPRSYLTELTFIRKALVYSANANASKTAFGDAQGTTTATISVHIALIHMRMVLTDDNFLANERRGVNKGRTLACSSLL